jgi:pterin-4a-carbinolamine dehydratase
MFKWAEFTLKWFGKKKEKLVIMKDNEEKFLQSALKTCAQMKINTKRQSTWSMPLSHNNKIRTTNELPGSAVSPVCENCSDYEHQIANILTLLAEINTRLNTKKISALSEQNIKMAAEIDS